MQKESGLESYKTWYPPVRETLSCLSKLYRCVEGRVFAGLAQDAVTACTSSVQVATLQVYTNMVAPRLAVAIRPHNMHKLNKRVKETIFLSDIQKSKVAEQQRRCRHWCLVGDIAE